MQGISDTDIYKLMDILSINDAAALIAGVSPVDVHYDAEYNDYSLRLTKNDPDNATTAFSIARKSLINAVTMGVLKAVIVVKQHHQYLAKNDLKQDWIAANGVDSENTVIARDDLKEWLEQRGVYPALLFPQGKKGDYMNPDNEHYAPKLALCIKAWEVAQNASPQGQTYKQFMADWIAENAKSYGVTNKNKKVFEELASIANWDTKGGKAKRVPTPLLESNSSRDNSNLTVHQELVKILPEIYPLDNIDNDLPF